MLFLRISSWRHPNSFFRICSEFFSQVRYYSSHVLRNDSVSFNLQMPVSWGNTLNLHVAQLQLARVCVWLVLLLSVDQPSPSFTNSICNLIDCYKSKLIEEALLRLDYKWLSSLLMTHCLVHAFITFPLQILFLYPFSCQCSFYNSRNHQQE